MMDAWLSSSDYDRVSAPTELEQPAVGVKAGGVENRVSMPEKRRQTLFELLCNACVPQMNRTLDRPKPHAS